MLSAECCSLSTFHFPLSTFRASSSTQYAIRKTQYESEATLSRELEEALRERIRAAGGLITFREYMELALYHPQWGYYAAGKVSIGREGDFTTSPEVDPAFGALLARFTAWCDRELRRPEVFTLTEFGAGSGRLMTDLLGELRASAPDLYGRLAVRIVDVSPALRDRQRRLLEGAGHAGLITWAEAAAGEGLVLGNELVDAFPVHRVGVRSGELRELFVGLDGAGNLAEVEGPPSTPELEAYFERAGVWPVEGQSTEVNLAALGWLGGVARDLERGFVLTIDYGDTAERLYSPLRPEGTLMSYTRGRVTENPYTAPGVMDMTAHVDFSALMRLGEEVGLRTLWLKRQMEFLVELGMGELMSGLLDKPRPASEDELRRIMATRQSLFRLIDPDGLGRFHVLLQRKGTEER